MLLLLFSSAEAPEPPEEDAPFYAVGGKGIAVRRRAGRDAAAQAVFLAGVEEQAAADRDERDMRELQEVIAALFTFKGIF